MGKYPKKFYILTHKNIDSALKSIMDMDIESIPDALRILSDEIEENNRFPQKESFDR